MLVNIDVPDLAAAERFYVEAFGLAPTRRFGDDAVELSGWPAKVYLLEKGEAKSVPISCNAGANICYGAWVAGDDRVTWGVGPDDDDACSDCCYTCAAKTTATVKIGP